MWPFKKKKPDNTWMLQTQHIPYWNLPLKEAANLASFHPAWYVRRMTPEEIKEHEYDENA